MAAMIVFADSDFSFTLTDWAVLALCAVLMTALNKLARRTTGRSRPTRDTPWALANYTFVRFMATLAFMLVGLFVTAGSMDDENFKPYFYFCCVGAVVAAFLAQVFAGAKRCDPAAPAARGPSRTLLGWLVGLSLAGLLGVAMTIDVYNKDKTPLPAALQASLGVCFFVFIAALLRLFLTNAAEKRTSEIAVEKYKALIEGRMTGRADDE